MPNTTLTWDSEEQHHRAQDRQGVGTTTMGERNGDHIRVGYDPEAFGLTGEMDAYFPLDSATTQGLREYHTGSLVSWSGVSRHLPGINQNGSIQFSGSGNGISYGTSTPLHTGGSFSLGMWVERDRLNTRECLISMGFNLAGDWRLEMRDNARFMFSYYNSSGNFQNTGSLHYNQMGTGDYHYVGLTYDDSTRTATGYLDGATDSATMSGSRPSPPSDSTLRFGRMGDRDMYPYQGILSDVMYFNGPLDASDHAELRNITSGYFVSEKQTF